MMTFAEPSVTTQRLKELLSYNSRTGRFAWRCNIKGGVRKGDTAGLPTLRPYGRIRIDGQLYWAHRLAWFYFYGVWPTMEIDHINGDHGNNAIANLREADRRTQCENQRQARKDNKLGVLGVQKHGPSFRALLKVDGRQHRFGPFKTIAEASAAYLFHKRHLHKGCTI